MPVEFDADSFKPAELKWTEQGPANIGLGVAEMDFGTAPVVVDAVHDALRPVCTVICRRPGHWLHVSRAPSGRSPATGGRWTPKWSGWCQTSSPRCSGS